MINVEVAFQGKVDSQLMHISAISAGVAWSARSAEDIKLSVLLVSGGDPKLPLVDWEEAQGAYFTSSGIIVVSLDALKAKNKGKKVSTVALARAVSHEVAHALQAFEDRSSVIPETLKGQSSIIEDVEHEREAEKLAAEVVRALKYRMARQKGIDLPSKNTGAYRAVQKLEAEKTLKVKRVSALYLRARHVYESIITAKEKSPYHTRLYKKTAKKSGAKKW